MGQAYQLEHSTDRYLLEDESGVYLNEEQDVSLALTGQQVESGHGRIRAEGLVTSLAGQTVATSTVPLVGLESTTDLGDVTAESEASDVTEALSGLESAGEAGEVTVAATSALSGSFSGTESGTLTASSSSLTLELAGEAISGGIGTLTPEGSEAITDDLIELQRQRRFGQRYRTLAQSRYPRKVR